MVSFVFNVHYRKRVLSARSSIFTIRACWARPLRNLQLQRQPVKRARAFVSEAHISANALATDTVTTALTINLTNRGRKWVLNNVAFKGGGTATGYFVYEAATAKYLAANIVVTPGPDPNNPLGKPPLNVYYYPWPNGFNATFVDDWSTASLMSLQNPLATSDPRQAWAWSLLQLNFAQALTNAGGTVALVTNPNVAYDSFCANTSLFCTPPPNNISQESFKLAYDTVISGYFRVVVSGTVTAQ